MEKTRSDNVLQIAIYPLYAALSPWEQRQATDPAFCDPEVMKKLLESTDE